MIATFGDKDTEALAAGRRVRRFESMAPVARRKLRMIEAAVRLSDLAPPPANRLEALKGDRKGQHSIRINDQWRICFIWRDGKAHDVSIVDYHS